MRDLFAEHAREIAGLPPEWRIGKYECFPKIGETIYFALTGYIPNRKGSKTPATGTLKTVNIPKADHIAWRRAKEQAEGICLECEGTGKTVSKASIVNKKVIREYRDCTHCGGTGKPNVMNQGR